MTLAGADQHADLTGRPIGSCAGFPAGGERELVGTEQQPLREGPHPPGGLLPGGRDEHAAARGKPTAKSRSRLAHVRFGPIAKAEEHDAPRRAVHMRRRHGDVTGRTGRLAGSQHVGGGPA